MSERGGFRRSAETNTGRPVAPARRLGLLAIVAVALASATLIQHATWNQTSHYALVQALRDGTPIIDRYHEATGDKSYIDGHYYSTKAPGLAFAALGPLVIVRGIVRLFGASGRPDSMIWALGVFCATLPALLLLLLVRSLADELEPGLGTLAALTLGLGTLVLPFSTLFFAHLLSATLGFAAFALLWRERRGRPSVPLVAAAGLLAGLAVNVEYPLALVGIVLGLYAVARAGWVRRGLAYAAGALLGATPLFLYNLWAFGSLTKLPYEDAVIDPGRSGHDVIGANDKGFFGVSYPRPQAALELLFSERGLLTLTPVAAAGAVGTVLLYRRGRRAEALVIGGVAAAMLVYDSGYYLPFGGWSPGPRFLIPALPFLAVPLSLAYRRLPGLTAALALPSAGIMILATMSEPLLPDTLDTSYWWWRLRNGTFYTKNFLSIALGRPYGWLGPLPFAVLVLAACVLLALSLGRVRLRRRELLLGASTLAGWIVLALAGPRLVDDNTVAQSLLLVALALTVVLVLVRVHGGRPRRLVEALRL